MVGILNRIAGSTVIEVGTAHIVRIGRDLCILCGDVFDGIVIGKAQALNLLVLLAGGGKGVAPPDDAVVIIGIAVVIGLILGGAGLGDKVLHIHGRTGELKALLQDLGKQSFKLRRGVVPILQIPSKGLTPVPVAVGQHAVHFLHFHVFADGVGEGDIAGEIRTESLVHPGGGRDGLLLDFHHRLIKGISNILGLGGAEVAVVISQTTSIHLHALGIQAVNVVFRGIDAGSGDCEVNVGIHLNGEAANRIGNVFIPIGIEVVVVVSVVILVGRTRLEVFLGVHCHLRQSTLVAGEFRQTHADGIDVAAVVLAGIVGVVMLGDLALVVSRGHGSQEAVAGIEAAAGTLLIGHTGVIPVGRAGRISRCAVGQDHQEGHPGNGFAIDLNGGAGTGEHLSAQRDTRMDVGAAVDTVTGTGIGTPAHDIVAAPSQVIGCGSNIVAIIEVAVVVGIHIVIMCQYRKLLCCRFRSGFAGEGHNAHPVMRIRFHQGLDGAVGSGDHAGGAAAAHTVGGIQHKHHVHRHVALRSQAHDLGSLRNRDDELIILGGEGLGSRAAGQRHRSIADGFTHGDLTGVLGIISVDIRRPGNGIRVSHCTRPANCLFLLCCENTGGQNSHDHQHSQRKRAQPLCPGITSFHFFHM